MKNNLSNPVSRRVFLGAGFTLGSVLAVEQALGSSGAEALELEKGVTVLFQGDSITDAGRDRQTMDPNSREGLGRGYPYLLAATLLADHPALGLKVYNRGISGNKVPDLAARWQGDAMDLRPRVLSILIGVNDIWHKLNGRYDGTVAQYEEGYRVLLGETLDEIPKVQVVICEPFVLRCGAVDDRWFPEFDQRRAAARKLADEFGLTFVPFQSMFDQAVKAAPAEYWAADGVHPTLAGHALMAKAWRQVTGL